MTRYTPEKIDSALKNLSDAMESHKKLTGLYGQMHASLERIKWAMYPNIKEAIKAKLDKETAFQLKILVNTDPDNNRYKNHKMIARIKAKAQIMKELKIQSYAPEYERWSEFIFVFERQWEKTRAQLIKDKEIKP